MSAGLRKKSAKTGLWIFVLAVAAAIFGCSREGTDPTGGETHFLRLCDPDGASCGELNCLCGACTKTCSQGDSCAEWAGSECRTKSKGECGAVEEVSTCENTCEGHEECLLLSDHHRCIDGVCRLAEDGSAPGADETCAGEPTSASEVALVGDSFFATRGEIGAFLQEHARSDGVLQPGEQYRDYSRLMDNALALSGRGIQDQYETAAEESPVREVIMNGGGADVLLGDCEETNADCPLIVDAVLAFEELLSLMDGDGVEKVVFVGYPDPQPADVLERMEILRPLLEERCAQSPVPCHWVDLRPIFENNYDEYVQSDGLNPTTAGSQASATAIWTMMVENCVAQ